MQLYNFCDDMEARGMHPRQELNQGPSSCESTALPPAPPEL